MTIDLRYVIPVLAFYGPGALTLIGAWALGYSTAEVRDAVALIGGISGSFFAMLSAGMLLGEEPIPLSLFRGSK